MTSPDPGPSIGRRVARWAVVTLLLVLIASSGLAAVRWDVVWGAVPGRIEGPPTTIDVGAHRAIENPAARLAVLGDVGTGDAAEWATAGLVADAGAVDRFDALVLLGDNAYPDGNPSRLDATVFQPFGGVLDQGTALLAVLGNHDVQGGHAAAQMEALGMPGRWYATEVGPALIIVLDSNLIGDPAQTRWLESTLAARTSQWTIVAMHHPAYSAGYHGSTGEVRETWSPIFERHGIDLVFAGHDHDYQRTTPINGVTYVVTGAGAKTRPSDRADFTAYAASVLHYVDVAIADDRIQLTAYSEGGPFDVATIDATSHPLAGAPASPEPDGGSNVGVARATLVVGTVGAVVWVLVLLVGWYGSPRVTDQRRRTVLTGTTVGMMTTVGGFGATMVMAFV